MCSHLQRMVAGFVLLASAVVFGAAPGQDDYLTGLELLQSKQWTQAAAAFAKAASASDENADYHAGAAVASMLAGDKSTAQHEFDRALRLNPKDNVTQLWAAGFYRMNGDALTAARIHPPSDYTGTVQEAAEKVGQLRFETPSAQQVQATRDRLDAFGVQFGKDRESADPELARSLRARVQREYEAGDFEAAQTHLLQVARAFPADPQPKLMQGKIDLARGRVLSARHALTAALTMKTDAADGYAARAVAHARLGELDRAKADMALAKRYDANALKAWQARYDQAVSAYHGDPAKASIDDLWNALHKSVQSNQAFEQQVSAAAELLHAGYARRLWWDEWYQDHLRQLEDDLRAHPKDANRLDAVASFLVEESDDPGEQLCPKGPYRAFREAHPEEEIARADKLYREAMAINPKDVTAIAGVADILLRHGQYADGETLVRQAMQIDPRDPRILQLLSEILDYAADLRAGKAAELRTPRTWMSGAGPDYVVWTTRYPSDAEQQRATQLDQVAGQLWNEAKQQLAAAVQSRKGTADGAYYAGLLAARDGNSDAAIASYQQAVKMDPNSKRYRTALIHAYAKAQRFDLAAGEQETLILQRQTTANVRYANAWNNIDRTAYGSAQKDLDGALPLDPCDERNAAYRGVLAQAQKQLPDSITWYSTALAINEGRLRLDGLTAIPDNKAPLPAFAAALPMVIDLRIGARQRELNQPDGALATYRRSIGREARVPKPEWAQTWPEAVLPNPADTRAFDAPSVDFLSAWSHTMAGNTLLVLGKPDDALKEFTAVAQHPRQAGPMDTFLDQKAVIDPHWSAYADATRLYWSRHDPNAARRPQWLAAAQSLRWLSGDETRAIGEIDTNNRQAQMNQEALQSQNEAIQKLPPGQREAMLRWQQQMQEAQLKRAQKAGAQMPPTPSAPTPPPNPGDSAR